MQWYRGEWERALALLEPALRGAWRGGGCARRPHSGRRASAAPKHVSLETRGEQRVKLSFDLALRRLAALDETHQVGPAAASRVGGSKEPQVAGVTERALQLLVWRQLLGKAAAAPLKLQANWRRHDYTIPHLLLRPCC